MLRFVLASGVAALVNFGSRILLSHFLPYPLAIALAFCAGLCTAFTLNRLFVFAQPTIPLREQMLWFVVVNIFALAQTMAVSLLLEYWLFPAIGMEWHSKEVAHAAGIAVPVISSYFGHKRFSFRSTP
ncbi:GtrA family protein [Tahibacter harae]|uniref:GtrA family protein n=1 Tax=Tahibacter harae TaxID=2963937 RepID=A0ABT1QXF4_9GAMM|nr:GtrA family protein [Tahibacter harae]MCQ4166973.1 GtrA family protein [Tahibacter harae]